MEYLEFGDALAAPVLVEPGLLEDEGEIVLVLLRHPAVAFTENTDEVWSRAVDFRQADW